MPIRSARLLFVAALVTLLSACTSMPSNLKAPTCELVSVQMLSTDMFAQRFRVRLRVDNPNDVELPVTGLEFTVFMLGDRFAEGVGNEEFLLPAKGNAEFDMLVTTNFVSSFGRLLSRTGSGKLEDVEYEIVGKISVDKGVVRKIPFNHRGTVSFSKPAKKVQ
jgi:LEA14-like dessication related protein